MILKFAIYFLFYNIIMSRSHARREIVDFEMCLINFMAYKSIEKV